jgi:hypothetical protein
MAKCEYCEDTREMITDIKDEINGLRADIKELFNHQSSRLPLWTTYFITILCSLTTGLIIFILKGGIQ